MRKRDIDMRKKHLLAISCTQRPGAGVGSVQGRRGVQGGGGPQGGAARSGCERARQALVTKSGVGVVGHVKLRLWLLHQEQTGETQAGGRRVMGRLSRHPRRTGWFALLGTAGDYKWSHSGSLLEVEPTGFAEAECGVTARRSASG